MQNETYDIVISLQQLLWLIGGITAVGAFIAWIMKPFKKLDDHEKRIGVLEEAAGERKKTDQFMMKSMNAIINHMIDNDNVDELKRVRDEYQNEIIRHHQ